MHAEVPDVGERVAERAQLPVEHGGDPPDRRVGQAVAEPVIAVGDRDPLLLRHACGEPLGHLLDRRQVPRLGALPLGGPSLELPLDVAAAPGEVAEADGVDVDGVEVGQHVDQVGAGLAACRRIEQLGLVRAVEHLTLNEAHDVERRPVDVDVRAQPERRRHGHGRGTERGDDPVLAHHVVRGRQHVAERRAPEHEPPPVRPGHCKGQVGSSAADGLRLERADGSRNVGLEPARHVVEIESRGHRATVVAEVTRAGRRRRRCPS